MGWSQNEFPRAIGGPSRAEMDFFVKRYHHRRDLIEDIFLVILRKAARRPGYRQKEKITIDGVEYRVWWLKPPGHGGLNTASRDRLSTRIVFGMCDSGHIIVKYLRGIDELDPRYELLKLPRITVEMLYRPMDPAWTYVDRAKFLAGNLLLDDVLRSFDVRRKSGWNTELYKIPRNETKRPWRKEVPVSTPLPFLT